MFQVLNLSDEIFNPANIYIPAGWNWRGGINDVFAFGPPEFMDLYFDTYMSIPVLYLQGMHFHPESLLRASLARHGLKEARPGEPDTALKRFGFAWDIVKGDLAPFQPSYIQEEVRGPTEF